MPRSCAGVSGAEFSQVVAPVSAGSAPRDGKPLGAAAALGAQVEAAPQYLRCQPSQLKSLFKS